ncbi:MAG: ACT domain-containing protein, partial [Proteobacteria bacterium]|nr:ACT domain-containing protein [Pseudomonadota bacterium]
RLTVATEKRTRVVEGTLSADQQPRIVNIMGIDIDAHLGTNMLFVANDDKPGFIGALGTLLGEAGINIASFHLGRSKAGGGAIALIDVDQPVSGDLLKKVYGLPHVQQVTALKF